MAVRSAGPSTAGPIPSLEGRPFLVGRMDPHPPTRVASGSTPSAEQTTDVWALWAVFLRRRKWVIGLWSICIVAGLIACLLRRTEYEAEVILLLAQQPGQVSGLGQISAVGQFLGLTVGGDQLAHQDLLKGHDLIAQAAADVGLTLTPRQLKHLRTKKVRVRAPQGSTHLSLVVCHESPETAAALANRIAELHIEMRRSASQDEARAKAQYYQEQLARMLDDMRKTAESVYQYKTEHGIVDLPAEVTGAFTFLAQLQAQLDQAQAARLAAEEARQALRRQLAEKSPTRTESAVIARNPLVVQLEGALADLEVERAGATSTYGPEHETVKKLDGRIAEARKRLSEAVSTVMAQEVEAVDPVYTELLKRSAEAEVNVLAEGARQSALESVIAEIQGKLKDFPLHERELTALNRDQRLFTEAYVSLFQRYNELRLIEVVGSPGISVATWASPPDLPAPRRRILTMLLACIAGLIIGCVGAAVAEGLDRSVRSTEDAARSLSLPVLGTIPRAAKGNVLASKGLLPPELLEPLQALRTALCLRCGGPPGVVLVAGAEQGEGRTTLAVNLAALLVDAGWRVLVVDADMQSPAIHDAMGMAAGAGLSEVLSEAIEAEAAIEESHIPRLSVLQAGARPLDPLALLASPRAAATFGFLRGRFDAVIVDSPAARRSIAYMLLAPLSDQVILVARVGRTQLGEARKLAEDLARHGKPPVGVALQL